MGFIAEYRRQKVINFIKDMPPNKLAAMGETRVLQVFRHLSQAIPAYKELLKNNHVDIEQVKNLASFQELVPLTNKKIFHENEINRLCNGGTMKDLKQVAVSSGFSNEFSFGLLNEEEYSTLSETIDILLELNFQISKRKTFFINCVGMGVHVATSLPLAETSVRPDMVVAIIEKLQKQYEQFIILGNAFVLKEVVELGKERGLKWPKLTVHLILGEDWFPECYRSYLSNLLSVDFNRPEKGMILSNFGICELGLSLFQESKDTVLIRRLADLDPKFRKAVFGKDVTSCPILFHYNPLQIFLEEKEGDLLFTTLRKEAMLPLIRYASGDKGKIMVYNRLKRKLDRLGYKDYLNTWRLPLVSVHGRKESAIDGTTPEQVKEGLYSSFEIAGATTGNFRISKPNQRLKVEIQLKKGVTISERWNNKFGEAIYQAIKKEYDLALYAYRDFPYGMELDYERKFRYI